MAWIRVDQALTRESVFIKLDNLLSIAMKERDDHLFFVRFELKERNPIDVILSPEMVNKVIEMLR